MSDDTLNDPPSLNIQPVSIEDEMKRSYLDYAMSVIVARAIPDVRDGLKPVHRRILYAMKEGGYTSDKSYKKSARIVGDVMGQYHPHGDSAIYDAMVRMAQDFSMRLPLVDGQGNFGSMDGDPPAAMRYTEARLAKSAETMLEDIDKDTVEFQLNYDESQKEPTVLPAMFPNLLVNGAGGIAVGMATNIPTHNLGEVIDACTAYVDNPDITIDQLMEIVPGPDFPTGASIMGRAGIYDAYRTGRGSVIIRAKTHFEEVRKDRHAIVVTEIPYQVNKLRLLERIGEIVRDKTVDGISDVRDESDRDGVRVVVELKRDADQDVVLNQLYRFTQLQISFGVNMLALNGGRPVLLNLRDVIVAFVQFREEVIVRRTAHELKKARERAHILAGLAIAVANVDDVVALIRQSPDPQTAREKLMETPWPADMVAPLIALIDEPGRSVVDGHYRLSEEQARAILELRLQRLTGLEREKIAHDLEAIVERIRDYLDILGNRERIFAIMHEEFASIKEQFDTPRRTMLEEGGIDQDIEDLIQREDMVLTFTHEGYIKRVPLSAYRAQKRGGKGRAGMRTKDEDFVEQVYVVNTHTPVLFFSSTGIVYKLKVYKLPLGNPQARGKAMVNVLPLQSGETISIILPLPDESEWPDLNIMLATSSGNIRRNSLADFVNVKANGKIAMKLDDGDRLVGVRACSEEQDVLLSTNQGKCIRFPVTDVRVFTGRTSKGVRGIRLGKDDEVISMTILHHAKVETEERDEYLRIASAARRVAANEDPSGEDADLAGRLEEPAWRDMAAVEEFILGITDDGYGKRTSAYEYRVSGRGGSGIANLDLSRGKDEPEAMVVGAFPVNPDDDLILVTDGGQIIRTDVSEIRIAGRSTRGVRVFRVEDDERVVSVSAMTADDEDDDVDDDGDDQEGPEGAEGAADEGAETTATGAEEAPADTDDA